MTRCVSWSGRCLREDVLGTIIYFRFVSGFTLEEKIVQFVIWKLTEVNNEIVANQDLLTSGISFYEKRYPTLFKFLYD